MHMNFTRGVIAGAMIGIAASMFMPKRTAYRTKRMVYRGTRNIFKRANDAIDNIIDMW